MDLNMKLITVKAAVTVELNFAKRLNMLNMNYITCYNDIAIINFYL